MEDTVNKPKDGTEVSAKAEEGGSGEGGAAADERAKLQEEFDIQRAKMKELFLQKEVEMQHILEEREQSQSEIAGLRAELQQLQTLSENQKSEIQSLQLLIHETVEASSSGSEEVRRLHSRNLELEQQLQLIAKQAAQQDASLAPSAIVRTLARRLGADVDDAEPRKVQDDERSLVEPLEEEIKALKEKLRDLDNQMQLATQTSKKLAKGGTKEGEVACDMCQNYEKQLVAEQTRSEKAEAKARNAERALKIATVELEGARGVHEETVRAWRTERAAGNEELVALRAAAASARAAVDSRAAAAEHAAAKALQQVTALTVQRQTLQDALDTLQKDNDVLVGKYTQKALEIQNEDINLPDTVEDLQMHCLRLRDELILSALGRERAADAETQLRAELHAQSTRYHEQTARHAALAAQYQQTRQQLDLLETEREQMQELGENLRTASDRIESLLQDKTRLQNEVLELLGRISSLQQDLDNSEKVQQDFVRLSQSLQVQLERIREADTEVRWQHEDDVSECPSCNAALASAKHKVHCRHCGRIFCAACVSHTVAAGPRRVPARVCSVCRTLLQPHTAPYFSTHAPMNH